jgi:hypothetical protein
MNADNGRKNASKFSEFAEKLSVHAEKFSEFAEKLSVYAEKFSELAEKAKRARLPRKGKRFRGKRFLWVFHRSRLDFQRCLFVFQRSR